MGNFLDRKPTSPYDKNLLAQIKRRTLKDIFECINIINIDYQDCQCINFEQFEDIFGSLLDDPEPFFLVLQNNKDLNGTIDIYETLAAFTIFSGEKFDKKVKFIFQLFDFDRSDSLELPELILTLQSAARGLCKFVHIEPPTLAALESLATTIFVLIDHDNNKKITYDEFLFWIRFNHELQEFLLIYAKTQTYDNTKKRFETIYSVLRSFFIMASGSPDAQFAEEDTLRKLVAAEAKSYLQEKDLDFLFETLRNGTQSSYQTSETGMEKPIAKRVYEHVVKAWAAFSASDINNDNSLVDHELHTILWVYENEEPSELRVRNEMEEIDKDKSGYIDRYEWVTNFCNTERNGKAVFRANLRRLFEKADRDKSGTLSQDELKEVVGSAFKEYLERVRDESMKKHLNNMISSLTKEIFLELDGKGDKGDHSITWSEFQQYMEVSLGKFNKLKTFLNQTLKP